MRKYLLPEGGQFFKANLHAHTTCSDGRLSPEALKAAYQARGYQIVAFTDHDIFLAHTELRDETFLPLNGYEVEITEDDERLFAFRKTCHLCFIALDEQIRRPVCLHREKYYIGNGAKLKDQMDFGDEPDYERVYNPACVNDIIRRGREAGFFVSYNHPAWSVEGFRDWCDYEGMSALELYNGGCISEGYDDRNGQVYDEMLRMGKRIAVTGSDDNHNAYPLDDPRTDSFIGWTMIKADRLDYASVAKALANGDFYATMGPEIRALYVEGGVIHVDCSGARSIRFTTAVRRAGIVFDPAAELTSAEYTLRGGEGYVRVTVTDKEGRTAETRAYFVDEMVE